MTDTFYKILPHLFAYEGGYVNDSRDPGKATNMGITHKTLATWRGVRPSRLLVQEVINLEKSEAVAIYKAQYWESVKGDQLPPALAFALFDFAVNSGPVRAVKELQKIVGTKADGIIGGMTIRALRRQGCVRLLVKELCDRRILWMKRSKHRETGAPLWPTYRNGWTKRVNAVREFSAQLEDRWS